MNKSKSDIEKHIIDLMVQYQITPQSLVIPYINKKHPKTKLELLNTKQICKELNISRATLYKWTGEGMPYYKKKNTDRGRLYDLSACKDFIKTRKRTNKNVNDMAKNLKKFNNLEIN